MKRGQNLSLLLTVAYCSSQSLSLQILCAKSQGI